MSNFKAATNRPPFPLLSSRPTKYGNTLVTEERKKVEANHQPHRVAHGQSIYIYIYISCENRKAGGVLMAGGVLTSIHACICWHFCNVYCFRSCSGFVHTVTNSSSGVKQDPPGKRDQTPPAKKKKKKLESGPNERSTATTIVFCQNRYFTPMLLVVVVVLLLRQSLPRPLLCDSLTCAVCVRTYVVNLP